MTINLTGLDLRAQKSKQALFHAFTGLVLNEPYSTISVKKIIENAGLARSTFYEHFKNKDDILISSMAGPFATLSKNATGEASLEANVSLLEHFWEMRSLIRTMFSGLLKNKLIEGLAATILNKIQRHDLNVPLHAIAIQLSSAQLLPVGAWLQGEFTASKQDMARILMATNLIFQAHLK